VHPVVLTDPAGIDDMGEIVLAAGEDKIRVRTPQERQDLLVFLLNFFDELRRRVPLSSK
jgi:hypothetical protein